MNAPQIDLTRVDGVLARHPKGDRSALVDVLHDLQAELRYLPEAALKAAAKHLELADAAVFEVATFYTGFHLAPRGEHICTVCMGTACHVRGAPRLLESLERDLGIKSGGTTPDMLLTVEQVNCVGACALGPLVILDGEYQGNMTSAKLQKLVAPIRKAKTA
ncbi:MAG: NAD(P)H-dependent oxidoreductase subunit E [Deltaproteobacteria bacterium]|nr:NAD(P)H-dependent oxidoreductase subunit E [Deltaproteobacteria bacterium]